MIRMLLNKKLALPFWRGWLPASSAPGRPFLLTEVECSCSPVLDCFSPVVLLLFSCVFSFDFGRLAFAAPPPPPPNAFGRQRQRRRVAEMWTASSRLSLRAQEASVGVNAHLHFSASGPPVRRCCGSGQRRGPRARPSEALMHMFTQNGLWILNHH